MTQSAGATNKRWLGFTFVGTALFFGLLWGWLPPRWLTNDDVAMSMVAHGYGIAEPEWPPYLMFSNIMWGYIVRAVPTIQGVPGYSIATLMMLYASCIATFYGLQRLGVRVWLAILLVSLVWIRPALFPQFTQNAGLVAVAAIVLLLVHLNEGGRGTLAAAAMFAAAAFLVRSHEFFFVLVVAAPLLPWPSLLRATAVRWTMVGLAVLLAGAVCIDQYAYKRPEWQAFSELNPIRARFTDFRANQTLLQQPEALARHGFSVNDALLIQYWFFADSRLADPVRLDSLLSDAGAGWQPGRSLSNALEGFETFGNRSLVLLLLAGGVGMLLRPDRRLLAAWGLFVICIATLGFLGRPGIVHVYMPLAGLLGLAPWLISARPASKRRAHSCLILIGAAFGVHFILAISDARSVAASDALARSRTSELPETFVVWGDGFPFEASYPILGAPASTMRHRIYGLGVSTLAPFSVAAAEQRAGHGVVQRLLGPQGLPLIASPQLIPHLARYCAEHHQGNLRMTDDRNEKALGLAHYRCEPTNLATPSFPG